MDCVRNVASNEGPQVLRRPLEVDARSIGRGPVDAVCQAKLEFRSLNCLEDIAPAGVHLFGMVADPLIPILAIGGITIKGQQLLGDLFIRDVPVLPVKVVAAQIR